MSIDNLLETSETPAVFRFPERRSDKLPINFTLTATVTGEHSRLLCIVGVIKKVRYFVKIGAEVSIFPVILTTNSTKQFTTYRPKMGSRSPHMVRHMLILTWVFVSRSLDFRCYRSFYSMDLPQHQNLLTDPSKRKLVDGYTGLSICETSFSSCRLSSVTFMHIIDPYY